MKNILVVNVNWLGDVIFAAPVFESLRAFYPDSHIACLAVPRVKPVLECIRGIDEIIELDESSLWAQLKLVFQLRKKNFDTGFLLRPSVSRSLILKLSGIPKRVGFAAPNKFQSLTDAVIMPKEDIHRQDQYLKVIDAVGVPVDQRISSLELDAVTMTEVEQMLQVYHMQPGSKYIVLNPGGNWNLKRWPVEQWVKLIEALRVECPIHIFLTGSSEDKILGEQIRARLSAECRRDVLDLTGLTSLKQAAGILKLARCVISADSGPLHLASAVGVPVIGIFGPTRPEVTGPRGKGKAVILQYEVGCNAKACYYSECLDNICMQAVSVKDVIHAYRQIQNP